MIIFVSHKLYAAQNSSKIIYLEGGKITAFGNKIKKENNIEFFGNLYEHIQFLGYKY